MQQAGEGGERWALQEGRAVSDDPCLVCHRPETGCGLCDSCLDSFCDEFDIESGDQPKLSEAIRWAALRALSVERDRAAILRAAFERN